MSGLHIDVADLLTRTRSPRRYEIDAELAELRGTAARVQGPVHVDVTLEHINDGLVASGTITGVWDAQCSEGLEDLALPFDLEFHELFEETPIEGETYPLEGHEIDLTQLVRDTVLLDLPLAPSCEQGHPELAEHAGDRGDAGDPRWAALANLEFTDTPVEADQ